ncbi:TlpA family protein disulfide reductase [Candidatus Zixiibacteriota bacterium]
MVVSWLRTAVIYVVAIVLVAVLGTWLGSMYGSYRGEAKRTEQRAAYQNYLEENIVGINLGLPFPDIAVEAPGDHRMYSVRELLPQGGLFIYLTMGCESCLGTIEKLAQAQREAGEDIQPVLLVTYKDTQELSDSLKQRGILLPLYRDVEATLVADFRVATLPTTFLLDEDGIVRKMIAGMDSPREFVELLQQ